MRVINIFGAAFITVSLAGCGEPKFESKGFNDTTLAKGAFLEKLPKDERWKTEQAINNIDNYCGAFLVKEGENHNKRCFPELEGMTSSEIQEKSKEIEILRNKKIEELYGH